MLSFLPKQTITAKLYVRTHAVLDFTRDVNVGVTREMECYDARILVQIYVLCVYNLSEVYLQSFIQQTRAVL